MSADTTIRSRSNPLIKRVAAALAGNEAGVIVLEGDRLIDDALAAQCAFEFVLVAEDRSERARELALRTQSVFLVEPSLMQRISALKTAPGVIALCPVPPAIALDELALDEHSLLLIVAGIADPGNLGALARSAEAFGTQALFVARGGAQPWNEKALRGSMGSLLRLPVGFGDDARTITQALTARGVRQIAASTRTGQHPARFDWRGPIAIWVGSETGALPEVAQEFEAVSIPMAGAVESLNVTVAAAVLLFASGRVDASIARRARSAKGGSQRSTHDAKGSDQGSTRDA